MFQFIHAADIHLDSPLRGLAEYDGAPVDEIRQATRRALEKLVAVAIERRVAFVLISGDLYDGDWRDHNTGLFFVRQMGRLHEAGIPLYVIAGNHDAANKMTRSLRWPDGRDGLSPLLATDEAETRVLDDLGVAIHGRSFANQAELRNLAREYPQAVPGMFNIGLLHSSLDGDENHAPYAPCSLDDLRARQYQYWALGHIHGRRDVCGDPHVIYPGNIQGRHIRETGAKGCYIVTVDDRQQATLAFEPLDVFRWEQVELDCSEAEEVGEVLDRFRTSLSEKLHTCDGLPLAARVVLSGACPVHQRLVADQEQCTAEIRGAANESAGEQVWIEKVRVKTSEPKDHEFVVPQEGPIGELVEYLDELMNSDDGLESLKCELDDLLRKLPDDVAKGTGAPGDEGLGLERPDVLRAMLAEARPLLIERLCCQEGE